MALRATPAGVARSLLSRDPVPVWETVIDGCRYEMHRGSDGDHRFAWADRAVFHLNPRGDALSCGFADADDAGARRLLCDTVLWSVSLLRGYELVHAAAIGRGEAAVALVARSGTGKSTLLAELLRRGGALLSDDVLALSRVHGHVVAHPGPPLLTLPLGAQASGVGRPLAILGDEAWVSVTGRVSTPRTLGAICVLERAPGRHTGLEPQPMPALALLPHLLSFPRSRERQRNRFELVSDLVTQAPVLRLTAGDGATPGVLADLVELELLTPSLARGAA